MIKTSSDMKTVAFLVWIFFNLAFMSMGCYIYLIVSTYWCGQTKETIQPILDKKLKFDKMNHVVFYETKNESSNGANVIASNNKYVAVLKKYSRFRRRSTRPCNNNVNCSSESHNDRLEKFKNKLFIQLRRVLHEESNAFKMDNPYFVHYNGPRERYQMLSSNDIKCRLKKSELRLLTKKDLSFKTLNNLRNDKNEKEEEFLEGMQYETCAIVSSAGSLLNSKLGHLIGKTVSSMRIPCDLL